MEGVRGCIQEKFEKAKDPPPEPIYTFRGGMAPIHCLFPVISPSEELIYAGTEAGMVHVWDLKTKREARSHNVGSYPCLNILKMDSEYITQQKGESIKFWLESRGKWILQKLIANDYCGFCKMSLLDNLIFLPDFDDKIIIYDFNRSAEILIEVKDKETLGQVMCMKSVPTIVKGLLVAFESGDLRLYSKKLELLSAEKFSSDCPMALDFCEKTGEGLLGNVSEVFYKFKIDSTDLSLKKSAEGKLTNPGVGSVSLTDSGKLAALGCWDGRIRYFSMKSLKLLAVLNHHTEAIQVTVFYDGGILAAGSKDTRLSLWNLYAVSSDCNSLN